MSWDAVLSSSPTDARDTLGFVLAEPDDTMPLYTPWRMADHRYLAIVDLCGGADEIAVFFGLVISSLRTGWRSWPLQRFIVSPCAAVVPVPELLPHALQVATRHDFCRVVPVMAQDACAEAAPIAMSKEWRR